MKKNFVKKLALGLALVVTATSVNVPAASAAETPGFKSTKVTVKVGQTKKYNTKNTGTKSDKKENRYSVSFKIGKTNIAKIDYSKGSKAVKVTGVAEGNTTLRADFKNYASKEVTKVRIPVTVKPAVVETAIKTVVQNSTTKLTATFEGDTSAVKAADIVVTRTEDNFIVPIKSVTVDKTDATKVVIETYTTMADGKDYTVTYNSKSSATFKATDGKVANVNMPSVVVTAAQATKVTVQTLDAANVVLGEYTMLTAGNNNMEFTIDTNDGYVDGDKLYLTEVGKTAKAKVVYHTWKYDEAGNETGKIEREFVITAVKDATVISNFNYTIAAKAPSWDSTSFKANTSIAASDKDMMVFFNIKDSNNEQLADYSVYSVASSDTSKLIVAETKLSSNEVGIPVVGVSAGTAYILLQNADGNTVKTFPVTVLANRKASVLTLESSAVVVSNETNAKDIKVLSAELKDQYGVKMNLADATYDVELLNSPKNNKFTLSVGVNGPVLADDNTLTITGTDYTVEGTYVFKINVYMGEATVSRTITVNVQKPKNLTAASYALSIKGVDNKNNVDLAVKATTVTPEAITVDFAIATKDSAGVLNGYVDNNTVEYTVKHSTGTKLDATSDSVTLTAVSGGAVSVLKEVKTGTYTVTAKFTVEENGKDVEKTMTKTFTVTDTQVAPSITVVDTKANDGATIEAALAPSDKVIYYYDGIKYAGQNDDVKVIAVTSKNINEEGNVFVQYVTIQFPVNKDVDRVITIAVNKTFTNVSK